MYAIGAPDNFGRLFIGAVLPTRVGALYPHCPARSPRVRLFTETSEVGPLERCERYLDGIESDVRRDRSKMWVHIDVTNGATTTTDNWRLPDTVRDRICCDGLIQSVWERDGVPFSVGRTQRVVPERTRCIIRRRDNGCRVPGCTNDRYVEVHHIQHWINGGTTDSWNLISLCPHHHRLHHEGLIGITGNADNSATLTFTDSRGSPLEPCGKPTPPTCAPPKPDRRYEPPLMGRVDYKWVGNGWIYNAKMPGQPPPHNNPEHVTVRAGGPSRGVPNRPWTTA